MDTDIAINIGYILFGLTALYFGAEWLVKGAARIALMAGISSLVVGLTVVAFGTSMPELVVSIDANLKGSGDYALGNIIGSNICNLGLVLGVAALLTPIQMQVQFVRRELRLLILVSILFVGMLLWQNNIDRIEGLLLSIGVVTYTVYSIRVARRSPDDPLAAVDEEVAAESEAVAEAAPTNRILTSLLLVIVGLATLILGANRLVEGGKYLATAMGVSEAVISLTLIAFGTSLPELATTFVACRKGESELAAGNAVGSCLFNLMCVAGFASLIRPINALDIKPLVLTVMVAFAVATWLLMFRKQKLGRAGGLLLVVCYAVYIVTTFNPASI